MSYRILRKLHGNDLEIKEQIEELSDAGGDVDLETSGKKKQLNINRYDLLNQQSLSESEVKEDDNDETEHASANNYPNACDQAKKKKKKRKKKPGKYTASSARRSSEDNADGEDDFTRTVKEVDKLFGSSFVPRESKMEASLSIPKSLLSIQHKNLNPQYEMKRMFGSKVVTEQQNKRRNARGSARILKSTFLVNPKDNWPPVGKSGIYMNLVPTTEQTTLATSVTSKSILEKNVIYFAFEHSPSYRQIQQKFLNAVESMDSDNIVKIINQHPYHVDSLIQLSELCKMSEDHAMASELIEHAILPLESSFHTMFSLTQGTCRLDYRRQENRALFITLFKHSQYLESRACSRTALEVAKLILTFDPINDPLAVILVIDYYALRSKQYEWLVQMYDEWESTNNLSQLPNMAYSYALALFYTAKLEAADTAIQYALMMFPGILKALLEKLSIQVDARVSSHSYFGPNSYDKQTIALQQLTSLYVHRTKLAWRDAEILPWLERNVNAVLDKVDAKDEIVNEYSLKRSQRYANPPRAILRHIILADFKEKVPLAQFIKNETEPILMYDPLPPLDTINIYSKPVLSSSSRVLLNGSPFSMFFQSLLPSFSLQPNRNVQGEAGVAPVEGAAVAIAPAAANGGVAGMQSYNEIRNSLNSIVDAMRDFLSDIRVLERPNDADVDEDESSDDDEPNDYLT